MSKQLILGSKSPSRLSLLRSAGISPQVIVSHVDESQVLAEFWQNQSLPIAASEQARLQVVALAKAKAKAVVQVLQEQQEQQEQVFQLRQRHSQRPPEQTEEVSVVLACDSMLEFQGKIFGKPHSPAVARQRWQQMRGNAGVLWTGHALVKLQGTTVLATVAAAESTVVHFGDLVDAEIDAYIATGEPLNVAGAFTLEGLGASFIDRIEGDPSSVIGLSLPLLRRLLQELDLSITEFWNLNLSV